MLLFMNILTSPDAHVYEILGALPSSEIVGPLQG